MKSQSKHHEIRLWFSSKPGDNCYVAQVTKMPGIMAHGDTRQEALRLIEKALELALKIYNENE